MAFGQLPVPVNPEDLLLAQQMGGAAPQPAQPPAPAPIPMQVGGVSAAYNTTTGAITAPDVTSTTSKGPSVDTTLVPETPKVRAAEQNQAATRAMAEDAAKKLTAAKVQEEAFRSEQSDLENKLLKQQIAEQDLARKDEDARVAQSLTDLRARQAEHANFKPESFGDSMGTFRSALAAIGMGLNAWGASRGGGPNTAFDIFKAAENSHMAKQRQLLDQRVAMVEQAGGNVQQVLDQRNRATVALNERYLQKNKFLQSMIEAKIKRIPKAAVEGQAALASLRKDYDAVEIDTAHKDAGTRTTHGPETSTTTVSGKPASGAANPSPQFDKTMALYGDTMDAAIKEMNDLPRPTQDELKTAQNNETLLEASSEQSKSFGGAARVIAGRALGMVPRTRGEGISDTAQAYLNAMDRANEGFQRVVSGANLQEKERSRLMNQLTILPGDSERVVQAKLAGMEREKNNFLALAGKAAQMLPGREHQPAQTPAQKQYTAETTKQIAQDKRDFAAERKTLATVTKLLQNKDLTTQQRGALEWAKKNPSDPRAKQAIDKIGGE